MDRIILLLLVTLLLTRCKDENKEEKVCMENKALPILKLKNDFVFIEELFVNGKGVLCETDTTFIGMRILCKNSYEDSDFYINEDGVEGIQSRHYSFIAYNQKKVGLKTVSLNGAHDSVILQVDTQYYFRDITILQQRSGDVEDFTNLLYIENIPYIGKYTYTAKNGNIKVVTVKDTIMDIEGVYNASLLKIDFDNDLFPEFYVNYFGYCVFGSDLTSIYKNGQYWNGFLLGVYKNNEIDITIYQKNDSIIYKIHGVKL